MEFFADETNVRKLYSSASGRTLEDKEAPLTIVVGPKIAEYVIKTNPSPAELEKWFNNNLVGEKVELMKKFAEMVAQTMPNKKRK